MGCEHNLELTLRADADTIRVLIATDNHVGYEERDAIRKDDSWQTFDEIMNLARTEDVRWSMASVGSSS